MKLNRFSIHSTKRIYIREKLWVWTLLRRKYLFANLPTFSSLVRPDLKSRHTEHGVNICAKISSKLRRKYVWGKHSSGIFIDVNYGKNGICSNKENCSQNKEVISFFFSLKFRPPISKCLLHFSFSLNI